MQWARLEGKPWHMKTARAIAWANWDYKGSFALFDQGKATVVVEAMLK